MTETILVAGGTGFTGGYTVPLLAGRGYRLRCLVRRDSGARSLEGPRVETVRGDLDAPASLAAAFDGVSSLISLVGLHTGQAAPLVTAAVAAGVRRAVFVSSTSIFTRPETATKTFLLEAEGRIRDSGLDYTIIRPTMVYGADRDRNISRLIRYLARWPVLFIPGSGRFLVQPIFVEDVARAVVDAFSATEASGRCYNIAGRAPLTFNDLVDTILTILNRRRLKVHLPVGSLIAACRWIEGRGGSFFVRSDQIERLNEDKSFCYDEAARDFCFSPVSFETGVRRQIKAMGLI